MNQNSLSKCNRHIKAQTDKDTEKDEDEEITQHASEEEEGGYKEGCSHG